MKSKLKKRLRKKYHVGEFQQFGFTVLIIVKEIDPDDKSYNAIIDRMHDEVISIVESEKLCLAGGGGKNYLEFYICDQGIKNTIDEAKVQQVLDKIKKLDFVINVETFGFMDAWNSTEKQYEEERELIKEISKKLGTK